MSRVLASQKEKYGWCVFCSSTTTHAKDCQFEKQIREDRRQYDVEQRIYDKQYDEIRREYGKRAAENANYGWGVASYCDIATKVYATRDGTMVLSSTQAKKGGKIEHGWSSY